MPYFVKYRTGSKRYEGWVGSINSRVWHLVDVYGNTLCNKFRIIMTGTPEQGKDDSPDNCATCKKLLKKRRLDPPEPS